MRRLLAALLLVALLAPAQLAGAEHVYSHRYVFEGRALDLQGLPVPNVTAHFETEAFPLAPCAGDPHQNVTDAFGDFRFCFHAHELPRGDVFVTLGNETFHHRIDNTFRRSVKDFALQHAEGVAPADWERTFLVDGKVWRGGNTVLEGVPVFGVAIAGAPVNLTLFHKDATLANATLQTDAYGDFAWRIVLDEGVDPREVGLLVESMGTPQRRGLDVVTHRVTVGLVLPREDAGPLVEADFPDTTRAGQPGSAAPSVPPMLVAGLGLAAVGAVAAASRRRKK